MPRVFKTVDARKATFWEECLPDLDRALRQINLQGFGQYCTKYAGAKPTSGALKVHKLEDARCVVFRVVLASRRRYRVKVLKARDGLWRGPDKTYKSPKDALKAKLLAKPLLEWERQRHHARMRQNARALIRLIEDDLLDNYDNPGQLVHLLPGVKELAEARVHQLKERAGFLEDEWEAQG